MRLRQTKKIVWNAQPLRHTKAQVLKACSVVSRWARRTGTWTGGFVLMPPRVVNGPRNEAVELPFWPPKPPLRPASEP